MTVPPAHPDIEDLLPHRGRMLLIDKIVTITGESAESLAVVDRNWPMSDERGASPLMVIELVAQTSGLSNGLDRIATYGLDSDKKGWLVGIKQAKFSIDVLPMGATIAIQAENSFKFEGFRQIKGVAMIGAKIVGEVTLQVVRAEQD